MNLRNLAELADDLNTKRREAHRLLGKPIEPPYDYEVVGAAVNRIARLKDPFKKLNVKELETYVDYLCRRFPILQIRGRDAVRILAKGASIEAYLKEALARHKRFKQVVRNEVKQQRDSLVRKPCQFCGFDFAPILHIHHVVPLSEGGDNNMLLLLCPLCHAAVHNLVNVFKSSDQSWRQRDLELQWWAEHKDHWGWWKKAEQNILGAVALYLRHVSSVNFKEFYYQEKRQTQSSALFFSLGATALNESLAL